MRIIESISEMQQQADTWRREGAGIAFVPTMGYLHAGHLALMELARKHGDVVVISIFVNPTQFGPGEDFSSYPRNLERDLDLAGKVGVHAVFLPQAEEMYPEGYQTSVEVAKVSQPLCGVSRPGHFRGVATVVTKLLNIVKPHVAIFGEKDFQQLTVLRTMVRDLNLDVHIVGHPIVREPDGLAMSSRNTYLSGEERKVALRLSRSLQEAQTLVESGEKRCEVILKRVREILCADEAIRIDYVQFRQPDTLEEVMEVDGPALLALAAYVGRTRLIDNRVLTPAA